MEHLRNHVRLSGERAGDYVVTEERPDGSLTLVPDTSWKAIKERTGARDATKEEWESFMQEHGPNMLPPDGEVAQRSGPRRIALSGRRTTIR